MSMIPITETATVMKATTFLEEIIVIAARPCAAHAVQAAHSIAINSESGSM
jgi:hypothetical protein